MDGLQDTKYEKSMLLVGCLLDASDFILGHSILVCQLDTRERHPDYRESIPLKDDVVHGVDDARLAGTKFLDMFLRLVAKPVRTNQSCFITFSIQKQK